MRWARTVRAVRPLSFLGLIVTHGLPWAVLAALVVPSAGVAGLYLIGYLVLRLGVAWTAGVWGVGDDVLRRKLWLVPVRDAIHFAVWLAGFSSNRVHWSGVEYEIRGGKMMPVASRQSD
jgi:ceramide glucosyltransferase